MTYDQAFHIGSVVEGYVKCTFAEIFDQTIGKIWSFQDQNKDNKNPAAEYVNQALGAVRNPYNGEYVDGRFQVFYDLPIVRATEYVQLKPGEKLVPVRLTKYGLDLMLNKISFGTAGNGMPESFAYDGGYTSVGPSSRFDGQLPYRLKYYIYRKYTRDYTSKYGQTVQAGTVRLLEETYEKPNWQRTQHPYWTDWWEAEWVIKEWVKNLIEYWETNPVVYVKAVAIDWIPTNINSVPGLNDRIAQAEKRLNAAKALLATAGAAAIIL